MSLRLGAVTTVVASSPDAAREILQKHDAVLSGRYVNAAVGDHARNAVGSLPVGPRWRSLRKIMAAELFAPHRLDALQGLRPTSPGWRAMGRWWTSAVWRSRLT
jgi:cytochrome P450